jgi:KUP system potassium uptake protein
LWRWSRLSAVSLSVVFLVIDLAFFGANVIKVADGGWFPLLVAALVLVLMTTWNRGRALLRERISASIVPLSDFLDLLHVELPTRVPGTGVFMSSNPDGAPSALVQSLLHYRAVHQRVILLTIQLEDVPRVSPARRVKVESLGEGFVRIVARYGFFEEPDVPALLTSGIIADFPLEHATFFLGRETVLPLGEGGMWRWRERLFSFLARNAQPATAFFHLPPDRVVEVGAQIAL